MEAIRAIFAAPDTPSLDALRALFVVPLDIQSTKSKYNDKLNTLNVYWLQLKESFEIIDGEGQDFANDILTGCIREFMQGLDERTRGEILETTKSSSSASTTSSTSSFGSSSTAGSNGTVGLRKDLQSMVELLQEKYNMKKGKKEEQEGSRRGDKEEPDILSEDGEEKEGREEREERWRREDRKENRFYAILGSVVIVIAVSIVTAAELYSRRCGKS